MVTINAYIQNVLNQLPTETPFKIPFFFPQNNPLVSETEVNYMSASRLAQNVRDKMLSEFDSVQVDSYANFAPRATGAVDAMLCGFILEGDMGDFERASQPVSSGDWYYNL